MERAPELLGELVEALPIGSIDGDYPRPCAAGLLGSNVSSLQVSSVCAGLCPAASLCPEPATLAALDKQDGAAAVWPMVCALLFLDAGFAMCSGVCVCRWPGIRNC